MQQPAQTGPAAHETTEQPAQPAPTAQQTPEQPAPTAQQGTEQSAPAAQHPAEPGPAVQEATGQPARPGPAAQQTATGQPEPPQPADPGPAAPVGPLPARTEPASAAVVVFHSGESVPDTGVAVETRPVPGPADGFETVFELARAAAEAVGQGAPGVVVVPDAAAPEETAWALELLHTGDAPLVLVPAPEDLADAVHVAAAGPRGLGCVLLDRGEIHTARYAARTGAGAFGSPSAGPLGRVTGGSVRLLWRPPTRITVPAGETSPLVGLHTTGLGDDGRALRAVAEHCDGLVVTGRPSGEVTSVLTDLAARIPVVLAGPGPSDGPGAVTTLDPPKARILLYLLLAAGGDPAVIHAAFAAIERVSP